MVKVNQPRIVVVTWLLCLLAGLFLITGGVLLLLNSWWNTVLNIWFRLVISLCIMLLGGLAAYLGTIKFFWALVAWLPKSDFRVRTRRDVKGPKIVVIGGGTGLGTILRGLKEITTQLTAIVTVADDGGSSGRLRQEFGILPPGDIRNCLVALADLEPLMERLMQYRFTGGSGLAGHNFGNLFLAALTGITGDFEAAIKESGKVLAIRGQVLPATLEHVVLKAELSDGSIVNGESQISKSRLPIKKISLVPEDSKPVAEAINTIKEADIVILGPGSLYTSVIPNLLVADIAAAIQASAALKVYICNAMTQPGETDDFTASDHIKAIISHTGVNLIDIAVINTAPIPAAVLERYAEEGGQPVLADLEKVRALGVTPLAAEIIMQAPVIRHDAFKLAQLVYRLSRTQQIGYPFGKFLIRHLNRIFRGVSGFLFSKPL